MSENQKRWNLLENGIDFVREGIERYYHDGDQHPSHSKYALLHLFSGTLLLLKERLRRAHPSLIYSKVEHCNSDSPRTVDFDSALHRLIACANVSVSESQKTLLRRAQKMRNQIEHYQFEFDEHQSRNVIGQLTEFVYVFLREDLDTKLEDHISTSPAWQKVQELRKVAQRIEAEELALLRHEFMSFDGFLRKKTATKSWIFSIG